MATDGVKDVFGMSNNYIYIYIYLSQKNKRSQKQNEKIQKKKDPFLICIYSLHRRVSEIKGPTSSQANKNWCQ